jgi:hypothetical protein
MTRGVFLGVVPLLALTACAGGGVFNRGAPDEFAISRQAPLVIPPDFALVPPKPGAPRPIGSSSQQQALEALFGPGIAAPPKSPSETSLLDKAGALRPDPTARSTVGDPATIVVDKGVFTQDILTAPASSGTVAQTSTGG